MSKRKIVKWTLAISKGVEDDYCLPFGTSVDNDTYGVNKYEQVDVMDMAEVVKLKNCIVDCSRLIVIKNDKIDKDLYTSLITEMNNALARFREIMGEMNG